MCFSNILSSILGSNVINRFISTKSYTKILSYAILKNIVLLYYANKLSTHGQYDSKLFYFLKYLRK